MRYRKLPVEIQAVKWEATTESFGKIFDAFPEMKWSPGEMGTDTFYIDTLEGKMLVSKGDFVIRGVEGEYYPCKPDIFKKTYEPVN